MDKVSGAGVYPLDKCFCAKCERGKGMRTQALYKKVVKPDYTVLLQPAFWLGGGVFSGTSASDKNEVLMTEEEKFFNTKGNKGFKTGEEK